ncbi:MAG: hypothetical protein AB7P18_34250 [Candidatus Binatia bacterium]
MSPHYLSLLLLFLSLGAVTIATVAYCGFGYPENPRVLVGTLWLIYALLTLAPLVLARPM